MRHPHWAEGSTSEVSTSRVSQPLMSDDQLLGLPELASPGRRHNLDKVVKANQQIGWGAALVTALAIVQVLVGVENPRRAYLWLLEAIQAWKEEAEAMVDMDYDACCFSGARCKRQRVRTNVPGLLEDPAECKHMHDEHDWDWVQDQETGEYVSPCREEAEYTGHLCFYVACKFSVEAVKRGKAKLRLPRPPPLPEEAGSRTE